MTFTLMNGFTFTIDPLLGRIGSVDLYWYGFAYTFGFAGLWLWLELQRRQLGWSARRASEACVIFIVAILLGGRLFEVAVYEWDWYRERPEQILMFWKGGMATHGLLLGSVFGATIVAVWTGTPLLRLLDMLSVSAAFIFGMGRIGNFIEGGVIGTATTVPWGVNFPGVEGFRHPVSLYDGLKNLVLVPLLVFVLRRWPAGNGVATGVFLLGYGGLRFLVDQFRDYESVLLGLGPGQWFNLAMAAAGIGILRACARKTTVPGAAPVAVFPKEPPYSRALRISVLAALILFPLCIPNSWDTAHIIAKRQRDLLPELSSFIGRICSGYAPNGQKIHLRHSCCLLMIITQEAAQSLATLNRTVTADVRRPRKQQDVALSLMVPLGVMMLDIFAERSPQRPLAE